MKYMIASDIHGSFFYAEKLMNRFFAEQPEKLLLLGDLLYHGPRNDLPEGYAPKKVITLLNEHKNDLLCVRGNCEAEVDQMVLEFPVMAEYMLMYEGGHPWILTHGHTINKSSMIPHSPGTILIHGHTHVQAMEEVDDFIYLNPGSVSIPKEGNQHSYMIYEDGVFTIKNLEGESIRSYSLS